MPNKQGHETSSVFVALVGRPNVGKSSLTNQLVGEKVAIVTNKPQTTRSRITGVITKGPVQYVLMDTPGIHLPRNKLDARMTQTAAASVKDVDVTVMLFEPAGTFTESEQTMMDALRKSGPALAVINKVDTLRGFEELEARRQEIARLGIFEEVLTVSAKDGTGCDALLEKLKTYATPGPHYFDDDAFTDMPEKELVAELIREKLLLFMREEIPHGVAVTVQSFKERPDRDLVDISVEICCERKNHKGMIIGKKRADAQKDRHGGPAGLRGAAGCAGKPPMLGQGAGRLAGQRTPAGRFGVRQTLSTSLRRGWTTFPPGVWYTVFQQRNAAAVLPAAGCVWERGAALCRRIPTASGMDAGRSLSRPGASMITWTIKASRPKP